MHKLKARAHIPSKTEEVSVQFKDLKLLLENTKEEHMTYLVNASTKEQKRMVYVNETTQVGNYEESEVLFCLERLRNFKKGLDL